MTRAASTMRAPEMEPEIPTPNAHRRGGRKLPGARARYIVSKLIISSHIRCIVLTNFPSRARGGFRSQRKPLPLGVGTWERQKTSFPGTLGTKTVGNVKSLI